MYGNYGTARFLISAGSDTLYENPSGLYESSGQVQICCFADVDGGPLILSRGDRF